MPGLKEIQRWAPVIKMIRDSMVTLKDLIKLHGIVATAREINTLNGIQSSTKELNILNGATVNSTQLNKYNTPNVRTIEEASASLLESDFILNVDYTTTGAVAIEIPSRLIGKPLWFDVKDSGGNAGSYNITITCENDETIDGDTSFIINGDDDSFTFYSHDNNLWIW